MNSSNGVIEIFTLNLKPGTRNEFHLLYVTEALPLVKKWNFNVMAYGPSLHDENSYFIIRSFKNLDDREQSEDAYYSSDDWRNGPRAAVLAMIERSATTVISAETLIDWSNIFKN